MQCVFAVVISSSPRAVHWLTSRHIIAQASMARTLRAVPVSLIWLTLLFLSQGCNALITPTDHDCSGVKRLHSSGVELLDATACSTNRALGYAIGKQFRKSIVERVSKLGPQLVKAVVRLFEAFHFQAMLQVRHYRLFSSMQAYTKSEEGEAAVAQLVNTSADAYPQYWQELEGIAEGSGLPKELVSLPPNLTAPSETIAWSSVNSASQRCSSGSWATDGIRAMEQHHASHHSSCIPCCCRLCC